MSEIQLHARNQAVLLFSLIVRFTGKTSAAGNIHNGYNADVHNLNQKHGLNIEHRKSSAVQKQCKDCTAFAFLATEKEITSCSMEDYLDDYVSKCSIVRKFHDNSSSYQYC